MKKKRTLKEQAEEKFGKKDQKDLKEKLNAWLDKSVNQPLAQKGWEKTGAGLSALGSAAGEMFIPESGLDLLMPAAFFGKGAKAIKKTIKPRTVDYKSLKAPTETKEKVYRYDDISIPEKEAAVAKRKKYDEEAHTLDYSQGEPRLKKPKRK